MQGEAENCFGNFWEGVKAAAPFTPSWKTRAAHFPSSPLYLDF